MKKLLIPLVFIFLIFNVYSQDFTWIKGPNTSGSTGSYGSLGVSAAGNNPGARHGCGKWTDAAGNLWLFGGEGYSNSSTTCWLNDLWKYNITTNQWTWIRGSNGPNSVGNFGTQGVSAPTNDPPSREFPSCWTDASGNFWMFGGDGVVSTATPAAVGKMSDLWKYNPTTNEWTWIKGSNATQQTAVYGTQGASSPSNLPGGRMGAGAWTDPSGNFWMFGGLGLATTASMGYLNDLWKYSVSSNQWTWVSGSNLIGQFGIYGTLSVPAATNAPGGRFLSSGFADASGNLYLFAGRGFAASGIDYMNDLWKYSISSGTWTWIHGTSNINVTGNYGTLEVPSLTVAPGGRHSPASWTDASGNFWIFGGLGYASAATVLGDLNDLFRYNPAANKWTWMKGATVVDQNGTYGTMGITAATNIPGGREYNTWWKDLNDHLWLFGGEGFDGSSVTANHLSDLWKYKTPCNPDSITVLPGKNICSGNSVTLTAVNGGPSTTWFTTLTSTTSIASGSVFTAPTLSTSSSPIVFDYFAEANFCTTIPRISISITVNALPTLTAGTTHTLICRSNSTTLSATGAITYTWNTTPAQSNSVIIVAPFNTTTYVVTGTAANGCKNSTSLVQYVGICQGIDESVEKDMNHSIYPNPSNGNFILNLNGTQKNEELFIINALGQKVYVQKILDAYTSISTDLPMGIYFYQIERDAKIVATGKLILQ